jgi:hypothetical protein
MFFEDFVSSPSSPHGKGSSPLPFWHICFKFLIFTLLLQRKMEVVVADNVTNLAIGQFFMDRKGRGHKW